MPASSVSPTPLENRRLLALATIPNPNVLVGVPLLR
jgi:hypothetical protein